MSALLNTLSGTWDALRASLVNPASNPLVAVIGLAMVILVLLIMTILLYLVILDSGTGSGAWSRATDEARSVENRQRRKHGAAWWLALVVAVVAVFVAGLGYSSSDRFCARCHYTERAVESRAEGSHPNVACRSCHEAGGVAAYLDAKSRGASNLARQVGGSTSDGPVVSTVMDAACLNCHEDIAHTTITARSIRVRHSDILEAGYHCTECHNTEGHGREVARARYPEMRYCIICHTGSDSLSDCQVCHPEDTGVAVRRSRRIFPKTDVVKEDCRGCHSMQSCIDCHGIELPHSRKFVAGYHARPAYTDLDTCLQCHDLYRFCSSVGCHNFAPEGIVSEDGLHRIGEQHDSGFRARHTGQSARECQACHGDPNVCEYCHGDLPDH